MKKPKLHKSYQTEHQLIVELTRAVLGVCDVFAQSLVNIHNLNLDDYNAAITELNKKLDACDRRFCNPKD